MGRKVDGHRAVFVANYAGIGLAWFDARLVQPELIGGAVDPGRSWAGNGMVPRADQYLLVAAINSGFYLNASEGGYYADGNYAAPLVPGTASLVIYRDGSAAIGSWGHGLRMTNRVLFVRQDLPLLVASGQPTAAALTATNTYWGATLGGVTYASRSALGIDAHGNLIFAAGAYASAGGLAQALAHAGARTAMELDINPEWVNLILYGSGPTPGSLAHGTRIYGSPLRPGNRYLRPDARDLIAFLARTVPPAATR
jgi:Phosphodiester glycosidase